MCEPTTIHYLEMRSPPCGDPMLPQGFRVSKISPPDPKFNASCYRRVGAAWAWTDLLDWTPEDWAKLVCRPEFHTWVAMSSGNSVGYFEIEQQDGGNAEIVHFGLNPEFIGQGFGRVMLREAIRLAWELPGTRRVWVHTCTNDHPGALENYRQQGFELFRTEIEEAR